MHPTYDLLFWRGFFTVAMIATLAVGVAIWRLIAWIRKQEHLRQDRQTRAVERQSLKLGSATSPSA